MKLNKIISNVDIDNNEKFTKLLFFLSIFLNLINNVKILYIFDQFTIKRFKYLNIESHYPIEKLIRLFKYKRRFVKIQQSKSKIFFINNFQIMQFNKNDFQFIINQF